MVSVIHLVSNLLDDFIHSVSYLLALFTILCLLTSFTVSCLSAHFLTNIFRSASFTLCQYHLTSVIQPIAWSIYFTLSPIHFVLFLLPSVICCVSNLLINVLYPVSWSLSFSMPHISRSLLFALSLGQCH